jgi:DNA polymerase-1
VLLQGFFDRVKTVGHNAKFDCVFLESHLGLKIHQDFDTMLAHYTLDENIKHGLKFVVRHEFGIPDYEEVTIAKYLSSRNDRYSKIPPDELAKYGAMDVVATLLLRKVLQARLVAEGMLEWPFQNILMDAANRLTEVELRGMQIDVAQIDKASADLEIVLAGLRHKIQEEAGVPELNPNSTQQLAEVLFDRMRLPQTKSRKVKPRSTSHEVLEKLQNAHPIIPLLLEHRRVQKIKSSYVENLRGYLDKEGRVHANFKIQGTEVSRLAVAEPALQTIPRPSDYYGALIRSSFVAKEGMVLVICDFSQAELRIYTCLSQDPFLLRVYREGRDLHTEVALGMFGDDWTKEQRVRCKMFNFSYIYGGNEYSFAQDQGLKIEVARKFVKDYNALMPVALEWKREQFRTAQTIGVVETRLGRKRRFPLITSENIDDVRKACVHMPCASSASDLTLMSANEVISKGVPAVLTVHDSILAECPRELATEFGELMVDTMTRMGNKYFPEVPWKVDVDRDKETGLIGVKRWVEPLPLP